MPTASWQRRSKPISRAALIGLACALVLAVAPAPASAAAKSYTLDLGARSDFVAQTNDVQCVGASIQMMLNILKPGADRSAALQLRLQELARAWSPERPDGRERRGANVFGWALGLTLSGAGPYKVVGAPTIEDAMLIAAGAMRETGRPVGLLVWRGRHAWVMSGFQATGDPLTSGSRITAAIVEDPLYPHRSSIWGPSPAPGQALSLTQLGRQFVPRRSTWNAQQLNGEYVLVIPYELDFRTLRLAAV